MSTTFLTSELSSQNDKKIIRSTLNSEKSLNALNLEMIQGLHAALDQSRDDQNTALILLEGSGEKAFCAGGDIRSLYEFMAKEPLGRAVSGAQEFFGLEYQLDRKIHEYLKPVLCIGHGIVMGGGLGLMAGASHRIVSEKTMIAMPEITIGLYPDVGASWFLNRMPGRCGLFLGLTGARLNAADALFVGLADFYIPREKHGQLVESLQSTQWTDENENNHPILNKLCRSLQEELTLESNVRKHYDLIQELTDVDTLVEFKNKIQALKSEDKWLQFAQQSFLKGSPSSAAVIFKQLEHCKHYSLKEAFDFEYRLSSHFAASPDFREGIRALIIDKDQSPKWSPARIEDLKQESIEAYFK